MTTDTTISIYRDNVFACDGQLNSHGQIDNAAASFGDETETEAVYESIERAIREGSEGLDLGGHVYTWTITLHGRLDFLRRIL